MPDQPESSPTRDRERQRQREPGHRRADREAGTAAHEPGLVAQPARPEGPAPALAAGQPAGMRTSGTPTRSPTLDVEALKRDITEVMTTSQDWWPADFGHYGPLFIRMSWHSAGTYRIEDGRGGAGDGAQRFAPLNSWPDNANLDKARRLLWPVKQKYGQQVSWADLLVFTGNVALESMGFATFGFGFGREDVWEPEEIFWGPEDTWLGDERYSGDRELSGPLGAVQMGLIYVNPEGPNGNPDPLAAARDIRETFRRMAMNDEETVALIAGGHSFGKTHGAGAGRPRRPRAGGCPLEEQGLGWRSTYGTRQGRGHDHQRPRGHLDQHADEVGQQASSRTCSATSGSCREPRGREAVGRRRTPRPTVPDAHDPSKQHRPTMLTTDLALRFDPAYEKVSRRFFEHPEQLADAFARAWYKLLHRDMGPVSRFLGPWVPEPQLWQDPVPAVDHDLVGDADVAALKAKVLDSGLSVSELVSTAWASAASFRGTDKRGGANGARIRLEPQTQLGGQRAGRGRQGHRHPGEDPAGLQRIAVRRHADLAGRPDRPGRWGCRREGREGRRAGRHGAVRAGAHRRLAGADRRRGVRRARAAGRRVPQLPPARREDAAGDPAARPGQPAELTAPEMTVLVGGLRALGANVGRSDLGVFTDRPGTLTNDFFVNLLDMGTEWTARRRRRTCTRAGTAALARSPDGDRGRPRLRRQLAAAGDRRGLRAPATRQEKFVRDFVAAWDKVMTLDRFDLA